MAKKKISISTIAIIIVVILAVAGVGYYYYSKNIAGQAFLLSPGEGVTLQNLFVQKIDNPPIDCSKYSNQDTCKADANCEWFGKCVLNIGTLKFLYLFDLAGIVDTTSCTSDQLNTSSIYGANTITATKGTQTLTNAGACLDDTKLRQYSCLKYIGSAYMQIYGTGLVKTVFSNMSKYGEYAAIFDYNCPYGCQKDVCLRVPINQSGDSPGFYSVVSDNAMTTTPGCSYKIYNPMNRGNITIPSALTATSPDYERFIGATTTEVCSTDGKDVLEYYCDSNQFAHFTDVKCEFGCVNGACLALRPLVGWTQVGGSLMVGREPYSAASLAWYNGKLYAGVQERGAVFVYNATQNSWNLCFLTDTAVRVLEPWLTNLYFGSDGGYVDIYNGTGIKGFLDVYPDPVYSFKPLAGITGSNSPTERYLVAAASKVYGFIGSQYSPGSFVSINRDVTLPVYSLAKYNNQIYVGLTKSSGGIGTYSLIAKSYDGSQWISRGTIASGVTNETAVTALAAQESFTPHIFAGTNTGEVYSYDTATNKWYRRGISTGQLSTSVNAIVALSNYLYVRTDNGDIYKYDGSNWIKIGSFRVSTQKYFFDRSLTTDGTKIYAGRSDGTVWRYDG